MFTESRESQPVRELLSSSYTADYLAKLIGCGVLMVSLALGCSGDTEPDVDHFIGRWLLETVNGQQLPAEGTSAALIGQIIGGRLTLHEPGGGRSRWEWCDDAGAREEIVTYVADEPDRATVRFSFPLSAPIDTLRLAANLLTFEHNRDAGDNTDQLRFRPLAEGEAEGPVCAL